MNLLETNYEQNNKLSTCVSLLELESESITMSAKIWSFARSICSMHNVNPLSNGKVLLCLQHCVPLLVIDACPSLISLVISWF